MRGSIGSRLFFLTAASIAVIVITAVGVTSWIGQGIAERSVEQALRSSQSVQRAFADRQAVQLELVSQLIASDPAFISYIAEATQPRLPGVQSDRRSIGDLLRERQRQFGLDFALIADGEGRQIARSDIAEAVERDLTDRPVLARAVSELVPVRGYWRDEDALYQVAAIPLARGGTLIGFLITGLGIDNETAGEIAQTSGAELALLLERDESIEPIASSVDVSTSDELASVLRQRPELWNDVFDGDKAAYRVDLDLGSEEWAARLTPVDEASGGRLGALVAMVSLDAVLAPHRSIRNMLILSGALSLLVAMIVAFVISRSALEPIRTMSDAVDLALEGDYRQRIHTSGAHELSQLGRSFNRLVSDMREEKALDAHIQEMNRKIRVDKRPEPGEADRELELLEPGTDLADRFRIVATLGVGGMGTVYLAHDRELGENVALKMLHPDFAREPGNIDRLKNEIRLTRKITHPNVVRVHDFGVVDQQTYISMEFVRCYSLRELLGHQGRLRVYAALRIARQLLQGLAAAHDAGVIHRDLKPENLLVQFDGTVKLMDFGIAKPSTEALVSEADDSFEGTPDYLSPEQIQGKVADERSDVYACGVILMELFTGNVPHEGERAIDVCLSHVNDAPTPPSRYWHDIPPALESIILRCLEKRPADRYQGAHQLREALEACELELD